MKGRASGRMRRLEPSLVIRVLAINLCLALCVALPMLITLGAISTWILGADWKRGAETAFSLSAFVGGFIYWYIVLCVPVAVIAFLHQLPLAMLPHDLSPLRERAIIVGSAVAIGLATVAYLIYGATEVHLGAIVLVVLPAAAAYGMLARPYRKADQ